MPTKKTPVKPEIQTRINITLGTKGGVGKSTLAVHMADYLLANDLPVLLIDMDDENSTLSRFFPQSIKLNPRKTKAVDSLIVEYAESGEHPMILADLRAGSGDEMLHWFKDVPFEDLREEGIAWTGYGCVTTDPDSVGTFLNWTNHIGDAIDYVVCRNEKDGEDIMALDRSKQGQAFLKQFNPPTVTIPSLKPEIMSEMNNRDLSISSVLSMKEKVRGLNDTMMKGRLRRYQANLFAEFDAIKELVLP